MCEFKDGFTHMQRYINIQIKLPNTLWHSHNGR